MLMAVLAVTVIVISGITANPVASPSVLLSEIAFSENGSWSIELLVQDTDADLKVDSVFLRSRTMQIAIPITVIPQRKQAVVVLSRNTLPASFTLDRNGDSLVLAWYVNKHREQDVLTYGPQGTVAVPAPGSGQSIMRLHGNVFAISSAPSLGMMNDTVGACGALHGRLLDDGHHPVPNMEFTIDYPVTTSSTGEFTTCVLARNLTVRQIYYRTGLAQRTCPVQELHLAMMPGSTWDDDIVLTGKLLASDPAPTPIDANLFVLYPNPVRAGDVTTCSTELPVGAMAMNLTLFDAAGRIVLARVLDQAVTEIRIPQDLPAGMYIAALYSNAKRFSAIKCAVIR
jgi:hypothetical protein